MPRKMPLNISSFDLLLDTMCNTFGGIVFIALLLALMPVGQSRQAKAPQPSQNEAALEKTIEELWQAAHVFGGRDSLPLPFMLQAAVDHLKQAVHKARIGLSEMKARKTAVQVELSMAERELDLLKQQAVRLEQMPPDDNSLVRDARYPLLHTVHKSTLFLAVMNHKIYAVHDVSPGPGTLFRDFDHEDCDVVGNRFAMSYVVTVRPDAGSKVVIGDIARGKLKKALHNLDPKKTFISFVVDKRSFAEFNYVKEMFLERGFEYMWWPHESPFTIHKSSRLFAQ